MPAPGFDRRGEPKASQAVDESAGMTDSGSGQNQFDSREKAITTVGPRGQPQGLLSVVVLSWVGLRSNRQCAPLG